ncbi:hypothetical protein ACYULU_05460 [Breznakiellaceae bacterium SP9]
MKKIYCVSLLFWLPFWAYAQTRGFSLGDFSFSVSPKILKDGSITDIGLGLRYTEGWGGELRFRNTNISKNEELDDVADSLNAVHENIFEVFFLPAEYYFIRTPKTKLWIGAGGYYEYDKLKEKGFFNMPALENLTPPRERVNSYTNDFSMHLAGPLLDFGIAHAVDLFNISLSGGIVPVFFLTSYQKMSVVPLLDPGYAEYEQNTWGSPYFYMSLNTVLFKFINVILLYDIARLNYKNIDFDDNLAWINPEKTIVTQSFKIEASLLLPLRGIYAQIGYGYTFDSTQQDAGTPVKGNRQYIIVTAKRMGN